MRRCPADLFLAGKILGEEAFDETDEIVDTEEDRFIVGATITGDEAKYAANIGGIGLE